MRYEVQKTRLEDTLGRSKVDPTWSPSRKAFTLKGARRVFWKHVNKQTIRPMIYRIYDKKHGKVVEL